MERVTDYAYAEAISAAYQLLPPAIAERVRHVHFLVGADPLAAGLHFTEVTQDGRSYRETPHCVYPFHQLHLPRARRHTTIVLPAAWRPALRNPKLATRVVVHELGHVLHEVLGFEYEAKPVNAYAQRDYLEAFAEALVAHAVPWVPGWMREELYRDPATVYLFDKLAAGEEVLSGPIRIGC